MALLKKLFYLKKSLQIQKKSRKEIDKFVFKRLKNILIYAYNNISYYRNSFDSVKFNPFSFSNFSDIKKIPILTKDNVRDNFFSLQNEKIPLALTRFTSGSSGDSLLINYDEDAVDYSEAIYFRSLLNSGLKLFQKGAYFWDKPFPPKKYYNYNLINKHFVWTFLDVEEQIKSLNRICADYWYVFPSILKLLLLKKELIKKKCYPKFIISTGEILDVDLKNKLQFSFRCPVYDHYGTQELNRVAESCLFSDSLHIDEDAVYFEFDNNNSEVDVGEQGQIILTGLFNKRMPLIRYQVGDIGIKDTNSSCGCNNNFYKIHSLIGRNDDIIKRIDRDISPRGITGLIDNYSISKEIISWKLIQLKLNYFEFYFVKGPFFNDHTERNILNDCKKILLDEVNIKFIKLDKILRNLGGKHRCIKSNIS